MDVPDTDAVDVDVIDSSMSDTSDVIEAGVTDATVGCRPSSIAALDQWLVGDVGVTRSGTAVTRWNDQSGHGHDVLGTSGVTLAAGVAAGHDAIDFTGGTLAESCGTACTQWFGEFTVAVVYSIHSPTAGIAWSKADGVGTQVTFASQSTRLALEVDLSSSGGANTPFWFSGDPADSFHLVMVQFVLPRDAEYYLDGRSFGSDSGAAFFDSLHPGGPIRLGTFNGRVAEVVTFNGHITAAERDCLTAFERDRYAIPLPP